MTGISHRPHHAPIKSWVVTFITALMTAAPAIVHPQTIPDSLLADDQFKAFGIETINPLRGVEQARQFGVQEEDISRLVQQRQEQQEITNGNVTAEPDSSVEVTAPVKPLVTPGAAQVKSDSIAIRLESQEPDYFQGKGRFSDLTHFGYDTFRKGLDTVGPIEIGPVDPGYPIGAEDTIRLTLWGEVQLQYELTVSRDGTIVIPNVGQVFVAGTRLDMLRETLDNYLSKFYSGLANNPPTIFMDVTLARLRSNQVYIMGEVERPGAYTISSYATAFNAMYAIGGPKITGSLRDVRILREGQIVANIDLYDYLLKGISTDDKRLQINDIVFVPPRNTTVGIKGEVLRPGIYELKPEETLNDLVAMAGGLQPTAYSFRTQIDRIVSFTERLKGDTDRRVVDVDLASVMRDGALVPLVDGDIVQIFTIGDEMENYVDINGSGISRPGRYELNDSIRTVSDLITAADSLTTDAYSFRADLIRTRDDFSKEFMEINLESALQRNPLADLPLQRWDEIRVYGKDEMIEDTVVTLSGFVKYPGIYPYLENMTVYDLLFPYSGLQDSLRRNRTFMDRADIIRVNSDGVTRHIIPFNLRNIWGRTSQSAIRLQADDEVVIYGNQVTELLKRKVYSAGAVKNPGEYDWKDNISVADLILASGGFKENAWLYDVEIARLPLSGVPGDSIAQVFSVQLVAEGRVTGKEELFTRVLYGLDSPAKDFILQPNDRVLIKTNPDYESYQTVTITGEVNYPGVYTLQRHNETLSDIIDRAGGIKSSAYLGGGQLVRGGQALYVDFEHVYDMKNRASDVVLISGDTINIPKKPTTVFITGEIVNPGYYQFRRNMGVDDYIKLAGGLTEMGDQIYVYSPSGYTERVRFFSKPDIREGSTIRVTAKEPEEASERTNWSETMKDMFALMSSAVMIIYLVKQVQN